MYGHNVDRIFRLTSQKLGEGYKPCSVWNEVRRCHFRFRQNGHVGLSHLCRSTPLCRRSDQNAMGICHYAVHLLIGPQPRGASRFGSSREFIPYTEVSDGCIVVRVEASQVRSERIEKLAPVTVCT